jgi:diguanylate cyclase (GGDEF)-like protein/PAS domain S-box-containing protein
MKPLRAPRDAGLDAAVLAAQLRLLAHRRVDLVVNLIIVGVVTPLLWPLYPVWVATSWLSAFCLVILVRALVRRHYRRTVREAAAAPHWGHVFAANAFATSCLWGLTGSVVLMTADPRYHVFVVFVLGGMMAGGIANNAAYLPAMLAFLGPIVLPAIAALLSRGEIMQIEMGVMLAIFAATMIMAGRDINQSVVENIRLRLIQHTLSVKLEASEAAMTEAQALAHIGSWDNDLRTNSVVWSAETSRIFGAGPDTMRPSYEAILGRIHPTDRPSVERADAALLASGTDRATDYRIVMDDGRIRWVHTIARMERDPGGLALRVHGTVQDVTERKIAATDLQFANVLLTTEMEASPDGILVVDAKRQITSWNQRFADMWRVPRAMLVSGCDEEVLSLVTSSMKDPQRFSDLVHHLYDHPDETGRDELETIDGRFIDRLTVTLRPASGEHLGRVWFFRDITDRKQAEADALRMARHDALTGLANRSVFVEALEQAIARSLRGEKGFAVLSLDLDRFKDVNDTLGHPAGDALLTAVAHRLRAASRAVDTVARFGGDEFAVLALNIDDPADASRLAEKLIKAIDEPFTIQGSDVQTTASVGIDLYIPAEASEAETLVSHADVALYRAKAAGHGAYRFFTPAMDVEVRTRLSLGVELLAALDADQLFLLYQPQIAVGSGRITGVEALVRWRHPERGLLGPGLFIPIAEKAGLVAKLGHWVLRTACRQAKVWLDAGTSPRRVAVNVSALQFRTPLALERDVRAVLQETALPPWLLELELTETALLDSSVERLDVLERLRGMGVSLAIDDFGTGYSSLDYLRRLTVDRIKIARTFITHLDTTPKDAAIVKATIGLFRDLGITIVAEGVETGAQFALLKDWGCSEVQGFYFSAPLAVDDITHVLRDGSPIRPGVNRETVA